MFVEKDFPEPPEPPPEPSLEEEEAPPRNRPTKFLVILLAGLLLIVLLIAVIGVALHFFQPKKEINYRQYIPTARKIENLTKIPVFSPVTSTTTSITTFSTESTNESTTESTTKSATESATESTVSLYPLELFLPTEPIYYDEEDIEPTLMPKDENEWESSGKGKIEIIPADASMEFEKGEGFSTAMELCRERKSYTMVAPTNQSLWNEVYEKAKNFRPTAKMMSPIVLIDVRFRLDDWKALNGSRRMFNGALSTLWYKNYSSIKITDDMACTAIISVADEKRLIAPHHCNQKSPCYVCETPPSDDVNCEDNMCYKLFIEDITPREAAKKCARRKGALAAPSSLLMLDRLLLEVDDNDANKQCIKVTVGFVRDQPLENSRGFSLDEHIKLQHFTEIDSKLGYSCIGFDLVKTKKFTRVSCSQPHGAICIGS